MNKNNSSRRQFLKTALVFSVLPIVAKAEEKRAPRPGAGGGGAADLNLPLVEPGKGMAANMNYVLNHADIKDAALKADRSGVKFADQKCAGCMLYTAAGKKGADEVGKCTLFANQLVKSNAWCASWAKKA